jgi:hypothetical protein
VGKRHSPSSQARGQRPTCPPLGCRRRQLARQPTRCRLPPGHGCPASSSCGEEGGGTNPDVALPPRGKTSSSSPPPGELTAVVVAVALRGEEYHIVDVVEAAFWAEEVVGDYPSGTQWEVVRQHAADPYLARQMSAFRPRGVLGPTSKIVAVCPSPDGLARDGTQRGGPRLVLSCARGMRLQ